MIDFKEEINRFKPSLDIDNIEEAIAKTDLTDMNDIMIELLKDGILHNHNDMYDMGTKNGL